MNQFVVVVAAFGFVHFAQPVHACTGPVAPETRFFRFEAPAGGLWWVHGVDARFNAESLPIFDTTGTEFIVEVVSLGLQGSAGLRVPDVAPGTRFVFPEGLQRPQGSPFDEELVVTASEAVEALPPPPAPTIAVEEREQRVGYETVIVSPVGGECTAAGAPGFWKIHDSVPRIH
ncbi:MAG: hypothetical protein Q8O67_11245 [Deltaproteobacteria bacterium]|nr:hypothetical protein [Deltaproteobacteria bacterium]